MKQNNEEEKILNEQFATMDNISLSSRNTNNIKSSLDKTTENNVAITTVKNITIPPTHRSNTSNVLDTNHNNINKVNDKIIPSNHLLSTVFIRNILPPPMFANMSFCENCHNEVGTIIPKRNRHHCRNCGGSFCDDCATKSIIIPYQSLISKGEIRACESCYIRIKEFQSQTKNNQVTWDGLDPLTNEQFQLEFNILDKALIPIAIFSCSYFPDCIPFYGHLYLTRDFLCFKAYKKKNLMIPLADITSIIKPEFYFINSLQIYIIDNNKYFFAEFNGLRDLCFLKLDQVVNSHKIIKKIHAVNDLDPDILKKRITERKPSNGTNEPLTLNQSLIVSSNEINQNKSINEQEIDITDPETDIELFIPDLSIAKMASVLECELQTDIETIFKKLWSKPSLINTTDIYQKNDINSFYYEFMENLKDIDIVIKEWKHIDSNKENNKIDWFNKDYIISNELFLYYREVDTKHPPKVTFPGLPTYATCNRIQRYRYEDLQKMKDIPYSDYFEIETRWVFTKTSNTNCYVEVGLIVHFLKSTWFKQQIISSTVSEVKETLELWEKKAKKYLLDHSLKMDTSNKASILDNINIKEKNIFENNKNNNKTEKDVIEKITLTGKVNETLNFKKLELNDSNNHYHYIIFSLIAFIVILLYWMYKINYLFNDIKADVFEMKDYYLKSKNKNICKKDTIEAVIDSLRQYIQETENKNI